MPTEPHTHSSPQLEILSFELGDAPILIDATTSLGTICASLGVNNKPLVTGRDIGTIGYEDWAPLINAGTAGVDDKLSRRRSGSHSDIPWSQQVRLNNTSEPNTPTVIPRDELRRRSVSEHFEFDNAAFSSFDQGVSPSDLGVQVSYDADDRAVKGTKAESKLTRGWKKFRQSFRQVGIVPSGRRTSIGTRTPPSENLKQVENSATHRRTLDLGADNGETFGTFMDGALNFESPISTATLEEPMPLSSSSTPSARFPIYEEVPLALPQQLPPIGVQETEKTELFCQSLIEPSVLLESSSSLQDGENPKVDHHVQPEEQSEEQSTLLGPPLTEQSLKVDGGSMTPTVPAITSTTCRAHDYCSDGQDCGIISGQQEHNIPTVHCVDEPEPIVQRPSSGSRAQDNNNDMTLCLPTPSPESPCEHALSQDTGVSSRDGLETLTGVGAVTYTNETSAFSPEHTGSEPLSGELCTNPDVQNNNCLRSPLEWVILSESATWGVQRELLVLFLHLTKELQSRLSKSPLDIEDLFSTDWSEENKDLERLLDSMVNQLSTKEEHEAAPMSVDTTDLLCKDMTGVILRILHRLSEPLIPHCVFNALVAIERLEGESDLIMAQIVVPIVQSLSPARMHLLQYTLNFVQNAFISPLGDGASICDRTPDSVMHIHTTIGAACIRTSLYQDHSQVPVQPNSLYHYYRQIIEQKDINSQHEAYQRNVGAVFGLLLRNHLEIFRDGSVVDLSSLEQEYHAEIISDGYLSDSALFNVNTRGPSKRRAKGRGRRALTVRIPHSGITLPSIAGKGRLQHGQGQTESNNLCDSAVEMTCSVDHVAIEAMREHAIWAKRSRKRIPRPSVSSVHSMEAAVASDTEDQDAEELKMFSSAQERKYGILDFLQEPVDQCQEEREIQLVEHEILLAQGTSQFLALNLEGLYPSGSSTIIPTNILPSVRLPESTPGQQEPPATVPKEESRLRRLSKYITFDSSLPTLEAQLAGNPVSQAIGTAVPEDHERLDQTARSGLNDLERPSQVPFPSRSEYELKELQAQCDSKDRYVNDLLQTVQSLQGQVNILNAKLVFLHDHHTTRPMKRRTLVRHSHPLPLMANGSIWGPDRARVPNGLTMVARPPSVESYQHHHHRLMHYQPQQEQYQLSQQQRHTQLRNEYPSASPSVVPEEPMAAFPEGIRFSRDTSQYQQDREKNRLVRYDSGIEPDLCDLEDDEAVSFLQLDDGTIRGVVAHKLGRAPSAANASTWTESSYEHGPMSDVEEELELTTSQVEHVGEDVLDEYYYMDAYKTMDQQLHRQPILPAMAPPPPMSTDLYRKHYRMSLPLPGLLSKRIGLGHPFRRKGRAQ
ncbi:hypothetical protein BGW38_007103 [Lunasporangiospora selenospora]|uniref:Uncharacterized protein n=1 Tax=Lunasporangiospora selenospora TaxID=979761 RepID=A0A9P6FYP2_9FUNG|nr:hypothetical protein BGW38_007103 [Lunasporangiospora selenospora]